MAVQNDPKSASPPVVSKYPEITSPDWSYIYGDFEICPLSPDRPGHMGHVCVAGVEKLVVQNRHTPR
jgi:hypothetical protein